MKVYTKVVYQMTDTIGEYIPVEVECFDYEGPHARACSMFGGASNTEKATLGQTSDLAATLLSTFHQQYSQQQDVLKQLGTQIMKFTTGQTGPGFSGAENAARIAEIQNQGAASARNAIQAERERSAGVGGGGTSGLARTTAINRQIAGGIEALSGANTSNALLNEQAQNFAQGRANTAQAIGGYQTLAGDYNPSGYASLAGGELGQKFNQAHTINQEEIAKNQAIMGAITGGAKLAGSFLTGGLSNLGPGESFGEGLGDFFKGGISGLGGG